MNKNTTFADVKSHHKAFTETLQTTQNIVLDGTKELRVQLLTTTFEVVKLVRSSTGHPLKLVSKKEISRKREDLSFPLSEVTAKEVAIYRKNGISSFILKLGEKLFHAAIPENLTFTSLELGPHLCSLAHHECHRLSGASDEDGGCEKVRNFANYIERYGWIVRGYETFNTRHDVFVVLNCAHYVETPPRPSISSERKNAAKLAIAQFVWPDVDNISDIKRRIAEVKRKQMEQNQ